MTTTRLIRLLNYALLVVNVTALATLLFLNRTVEDKESARDIRSVRFLQEQLDLTNEQFNEIMAMSERTFQRYNRTLDLICQTNIKLLEEMAKQDPDQDMLRRHTGLIGRLHTNLQNLTVEYFDMVRGICSEEQNALLAVLFKEMMQLEDQCIQCVLPNCDRQEQLQQLGHIEQTKSFD